VKKENFIYLFDKVILNRGESIFFVKIRRLDMLSKETVNELRELADNSKNEEMKKLIEILLKESEQLSSGLRGY
jgi:hypothetical protein|tara:strand:+ start:1385 stop:1606 length:222 start_codon:yes stop_codon:yes gene_type:complete